MMRLVFSFYDFDRTLAFVIMYPVDVAAFDDTPNCRQSATLSRLVLNCPSASAAQNAPDWCQLQPV